MSPAFINLLQRITGLLVFVLLSVQILLGAFMGKWREKLGVIIFLLMLTHLLLFVLLNFKLKGVIDPFYVFTDFCLMCPKLTEFYYTLGRVSFWLMSLTVLAAVLRNEPWWRKNWRKFHRLNYVVFLLMAAYLFFVF
jgi:DMSO/TMAO reductase YedYZ heme-binding membrane subunit